MRDEITIELSEDKRPECSLCFSRNEPIIKISGKGFVCLYICENCLNEINKKATELLKTK